MACTPLKRSLDQSIGASSPSIRNPSHALADSVSSTSSWSTSAIPQTPKTLVPDDKCGDSIDSKLSMEWSPTNERVIREPYDYIAALPGKEIRRKLLDAFNVWLKVDEESCEIIARTITMAHNASLMIDDIQDNSQLRRGVPTAHRVYGIAQTINAANYVYFQAQQELMRLKNWPQALAIFNDELINLHRGQGMELFWRDNFQPPSEGDYLQMIANKTGGLFRLILRLLQCASTRVVDITPLANVVGLFFQILDDYKNMVDDKMAAQKGYCDDLTEGKFSFPICHAIWTESSRKDDILDILRMKTEDDTLKACAVTSLRQSGSFGYTRQVLEQLNKRARELLLDLKVPNPKLEALLDTLVKSFEACH
ncbi:geranylgeranyl pyrophosphate synthetase [Microsporum canis]